MAKSKNNLEKSRQEAGGKPALGSTRATSAGASRFMTLAEVQLYLGIKSRKTLLKYIKAGKLAAIKMGGTRWRVQRAHVRDFINSSRKNSHSVTPKDNRG